MDFDEDTCDGADMSMAASRSENLEMLKWLYYLGGEERKSGRSRRCRWDQFTCYETAMRFCSGYIMLAVHGTKGHAKLQLGMDIGRFFIGPLITVARNLLMTETMATAKTDF